GRETVHQERVGSAGHVRNVGRVHPHLGPHPPVTYGGPKAVASDITEEVEDGALLEVVVVGLLLELGQDPIWILERPVGEYHKVFAVEPVRVSALGLDDE